MRKLFENNVFTKTIINISDINFYEQFSAKIDRNIELKLEKQNVFIVDFATALVSKIPDDESMVSEFITQDIPKAKPESFPKEAENTILINEIVRGAYDFSKNEFIESHFCISSLMVVGEGGTNSKANIDKLGYIAKILNEAWTGVAEISYKPQAGNQLCFTFKFL